MEESHSESWGSDMVHIADLYRVKHLVKIKRLAELADLNPASVAQKVGRGTELTVAEAKSMMDGLYGAGIIVRHQP